MRCHHFNPLFPYGKRPRHLVPKVAACPISIHSSHTGRDLITSLVSASPLDFNPLFPYGKRQAASRDRAFGADFNPLFPYGKRPCFRRRCGHAMPFQSTLPIREETQPATATGERQRNFNPLFPYGKRPRTRLRLRGRAGFQSTLPIREETGRGCSLPWNRRISIHSSHTGRDQT